MLTSLGKYKTYIGMAQSNTTQDELFKTLIQFSDSFIKEQCGLWLEKQVITSELLAGRNRNFIIPRERPIISVENLYYDSEGRYGQLSGSFDPVLSLQVVGTDYILKIDQNDRETARYGYTSRSGIIYLLGGQGIARRERFFGYLNTRYMPTFGTFKISYTSGYSTLPPWIELTANTCVRALQMAAKRAGITLTSESDKWYSWAGGVLITEVTLTNLLATLRGMGASISN